MLRPGRIRPGAWIRQMENRSKEKNSIAFTVELFMIFMILLCVIVVITQVFVKTRGESIRARELTEAVIAAESAAEVAESAGDDGEREELLRQMEGASDVKASGGAVSLCLTYGDKGETPRKYDVKVESSDKKTKAGTYTESTVTVSRAGSGEELYTLSTGRYEKEAE